MKLSDYKRLGKISIKARKKSTKNTVRGIAFGLIIIIPIIFFALAFYLDLTKKINNLLTVSSFKVETSHYDLTLDNNLEKAKKLPFESIDDMISFNGVSEHYVDQYFDISYSPYAANYPYLLIDNARITLPAISPRENLNPYIKICYANMSSQIITEAEKKDLKKTSDNESPFLYGRGFYGDGKKQIILSETFLRNIMLLDESIIGKKISLYYVPRPMDKIYVDNNNDPNDYFELNSDYYSIDYIKMFDGYEIVGVLRKELYKLPSRAKEAHVWFNYTSLYNDNNLSALPIYTKYESGTDLLNIYTYSSNDLISLANETTKNGYLFIPIGIGAKYLNSLTPTLNLTLQCKSYQSATSVETEFKSTYHEYLADEEVLVTNSVFRHLRMINTIGGYIILCLFAFAGIILFATLLNLYNSLNYSVQIRQNYIGVMRAIGAKERSIPQLYFVEIMIIFMRTFVWVLVFGGVFSFAIKLAIDASFSDFGDILPFIIRLNFNYYFVALMIMIIFEFLIAVLYSQIACRHVAHKPILEILKDEK